MALMISGVCSRVSGPSGPSCSCTSVPSRLSSWPRNRVSASRGILVSRRGSDVSRLAAISLMAEFLAPLMAISPSRRAPPSMAIRSNLSPFKRRIFCGAANPDRASSSRAGRRKGAGRSRTLVVVRRRRLDRLRRGLPATQVGAQSLGELGFAIIGRRRLRPVGGCHKSSLRPGPGEVKSEKSGNGGFTAAAWLAIAPASPFAAVAQW